MASESFGCHDISRHWWGASSGWESCCFGLLEGLPRSLWWLTASSGCTARGVGVTGRGWGALWVGGAFVQYAQPLASGSRPSWSRPTRADSRRDRSQIMTTGTLPRWRVGTTPRPPSSPSNRAPAQTAVRERWGGPVTKAPGSAARTPDSLLRDTVSTALTLMDRTSMFPVGIAGILRLFFGVRRRCACDVSTMDTHTPSGRDPGDH